jgi:hydroxyacylglutathione hydrolase
MYVEQIYTGCLAEAAYYIESNGEAAIVDPLRETQPYLELAEQRGATIKYVFETHFHADFVSGHLDLARQTGAKIVYGPGAKANFDLHVATDGETLPLGEVAIKVLHTPGHTPESSCFVLVDEQGKDHAVFTGDTLFIGDVGRPDLAVKSDITERDLAGMLYESLQTKILTLADEVVLYPGHGKGSQCGKNMSDETISTIGEQRRANYALQPMNKEDFVDSVLEGLSTPPQYFPKNAVINKTGYEAIDEVMARNLKALAPDAFASAMDNALVLDTRDYQAFAAGHIPEAMSISLDGDFAVWVGTLIEDLKTPLLLVAPADRVEETVLRLARVGYEQVQGYLMGGMEAWQAAGQAVETMPSVAAEEVNLDRPILDVRKCTEFATIHVKGAQSIRLAQLQARLAEVPTGQPLQITCESGYRAMIAASLLRRAGYQDLYHITGGMDAMEAAGLPMEASAAAVA